jgi:hypothetical protein
MLDPNKPDYTNTPVSLLRPCFGYAPGQMSAAPAVSIITPFYNTGAVFLDTARSVLNQSLQQWEWLIINDGSTDTTALALLDGYRSRDPRIRVIDHDKNCGLSAARNTGFRAAHALYVVQLDSDDLLEPTATEKWVWFLESYPDCAFAKGYTVQFGAMERLWRHGFHDGSAFLEDNLVAPTSAVRTSVHAAVGGYDEHNRAGLEDWDFWLRCANAGYWGDTVPEYLDWYRWSPGHQNRWGNWDLGKRQRTFHAGFRQRYPRLWRGGFPRVEVREDPPFTETLKAPSWENILTKDKLRIVLFQEDLTVESGAGWEVSVIGARAGTPSGLAQYARLTPDVFVLPHFLRACDYPRFLAYFLASRQIDVVLNVDSSFGYLLLPGLRQRFPHVTWLGVLENTEEIRHQVSCTLASQVGKVLSDAFVVQTQEQRDCLISQSINPADIYVWPSDVRKGEQEEEGSSFVDVNFPVLLKEVIRRHAENPRVLPETVVGEIAMALAVELVRREKQLRQDGHLTDELRPQLLDPRSVSWRTFFYFALRRLVFPYYRTMSERHNKWLLPLVRWTKKILAG